MISNLQRGCLGQHFILRTLLGGQAGLDLRRVSRIAICATAMAPWRRKRTSRVPDSRVCLVLCLAVLLFLGQAAVAQAADRPPRDDRSASVQGGLGETFPSTAEREASLYSRTGGIDLVPTANQEKFDVHFYGLDLQLTPSTSVLAGSVRMLAEVITGPLTSVELDLYANMVVDSVWAAGATSTFSRTGDTLTVNLDRAYSSSEIVETTVFYHGTPIGDGEFVFFNFDEMGGESMIWTVSEPFGARSWWPCKDYPSDKADSVDVRVAVPSGMVTVSNGTRASSNDAGGWVTTEWQERYPIATYLVFVASYPYLTFSDWYVYAPGDSMEIQFYYLPDTTGITVSAFQVKEMMAAFSGYFGEYPFISEKYGQALIPWDSGMENQTCTTLGDFGDSMLVAHELAHHWWGNMITCASFNHIWLNEGFARYSEALWLEASHGDSLYHAKLNSERFWGRGTIYVSDETDVSRVFNEDLSYRKASWVLHMLRHVLGETDFYASLQQFRVAHEYGTATTEDFQSVCETVSGLDLEQFFLQWIYGERYPMYQFAWVTGSHPGGVELTVQIDQVQPWQLFTMPLDIVVQCPGDTTTYVVGDSLSSQLFTFQLSEEPTSVLLDPDQWVLRDVGSNPVGISPRPASLRLLTVSPAYPNPFSSQTSIVIDGTERTEVNVAVFDIQGRLVRNLTPTVSGAWPLEIAWDGRTELGRTAPKGMYWIRCRGAGQSESRAVLKIR